MRSSFLIIFCVLLLSLNGYGNQGRSRQVNQSRKVIRSLRNAETFEQKMVTLFEFKEKLDKDFSPDYTYHNPKDKREEFKDLLFISRRSDQEFLQRLSVSSLAIRRKKDGLYYVSFMRPVLKDSKGVNYLFSSTSKRDEICSLFGMEESRNFKLAKNTKSQGTVILQTYHINYSDKPHRDYISKVTCRINGKNNQ